MVLETGMTWHWLVETLEKAMTAKNGKVANPFRARIDEEATSDKMDAKFLRANLVADIGVPKFFQSLA
jgi:hypothetical protein